MLELFEHYAYHLYAAGQICYIHRRFTKERLAMAARRLSQSPTLHETLLHRYPPVASSRGNCSATAPAAHVPVPPALHDLCQPKEVTSAYAPIGAVSRRNYTPTFGISLNELKAAIAPRASSIYEYQPSEISTESDRSVKIFYCNQLLTWCESDKMPRSRT